jgi:deoxyribodipyrimidine photolyase-like uncharacterized protein
VNRMWILKNSKDVLEYIQSRYLSSCNRINTYDFNMLSTPIPHSKLKCILRELVQLCFINNIGDFQDIIWKAYLWLHHVYLEICL